MASRVLQAIGEIAYRLPEVRRDPLGALDLLASNEGSRVLPGLAYGPDPGHGVDLYLPHPWPAGRPRSAVVFFHGGRWSYGSRREYRFVAQALASRGLAVAVCDYRKYPSVRFPSFVEDGAMALAWAMAELPSHGIDPSLVFAMGHSAGAHIAALATMDRRYGASFGYDPDRLAGLVLMSGPFDFFPIRGDDLRDIFGPEQRHEETQPLRYARGGLPPMLFLHGRRDRTVRPWSSARMASAVRDHGGEARTIFYDWLTHTNILAALSDRVGFLVAPVLDDIAAFTDRRIAAIAAAGNGGEG